MTNPLSNVHMPTAATLVVIVIIFFIIYHVLCGRKRA